VVAAFIGFAGEELDPFFFGQIDLEFFFARTEDRGDEDVAAEEVFALVDVGFLFREVEEERTDAGEVIFVIVIQDVEAVRL
jgi:hypothetical protein